MNRSSNMFPSTSRRANDLDAALASLGDIEDDEDKDRLFGGFGSDELVGGNEDRLWF